ncbi:MAG: chromate transporter [Fidelibacterota bacterium]
MRTLIQIFKSFTLIGIGAYGGGLVTIPLIQHEIVTQQNWLVFKEMASLLAIAQMTPGPIAVNAATFVGLRINGILGAIIATIAVVLPSITILIIIAPLVEKVGSNEHIIKFREGLQVGVLSLIFYATWSYGSEVLENRIDLFLAVAALAVLIIFEGKLHPIFVILSCGLIGLFIF